MIQSICCVCDRTLKEGHQWVHVDYQSGEFINPMATPDHGDHGAEPIGNGCLKAKIKAGRLTREMVMAPTPKVYTASLGLDVINLLDDHGAIVYEVYPDEIDMRIEDGQMKDADDLGGLAKALIGMDALPEGSTIKMKETNDGKNT